VKIVQGTDAKLAHWPAQAVFRFKEPTAARATYFCGGAAIAPTWILTAAHCVGRIKRAGDGSYVNDDPRVAPQGWRAEVVLGRDDLEAVPAPQVYQVADIVIRQGYTSAFKGHDIALVKLRTSWNGRVAQLALSAEADPTDAWSYAAGFGALKNDQLVQWRRARNGEVISVASEKLQEVKLPLVPTERCRAQYHAKLPYKNVVIGPEQVCAGYEEGRKDSCQGDSGGPLVVYDQHGCPTQVGVVSWGDECAKANAYGVYTRVSAYRDWILRHVPEATRVEQRPVASAAIVDQHVALALKELDEMLTIAKGRVKVGVGIDNVVRLGGLFSFEVSSDVAGRLILLDVNVNGEVTQIFPNPYVTSDDARFIDSGKPVKIPDPSNRRYGNLTGFRAIEPIGRGRLIAMVVPREVAVVDVVEDPQRTTKGWAAEGAPASYVLNLFDRLIAAAKSRAPGNQHWAVGETAYEIVK